MIDDIKSIFIGFIVMGILIAITLIATSYEVLLYIIGTISIIFTAWLIGDAILE